MTPRRGIPLLALLAACGGGAPAPATPPAPPVAQTTPARLAEALGPVIDAVFMIDRRPYDDPRLAEYVRAVGERLAAHAGVPGLHLSFVVTDDVEDNAWSLPGYVYVSRGALAELGSEAELAATLAHEIGHVVARHGIYAFYRTAYGVDAEPDGDAEAYQRDQELQADRIGAGLVRAAGYDPRAMITMLRAVDRAPPAEPGRGDHPPRDARVAAIARELGRAAGGEIGRDRYLDAIEGLVVGEDPRDGVLDARRFTCVACGFALEVPSGFTAALEGQALHAESADGQSSLALQRVGGAASKVARAMIASFREGPFTETSFGGIPTMIAPAKSAADAGTLAIWTLGDGVYALAAAGPESATTLRATLATLRRTHEGDARVAPPVRLHVRRARASGRAADVLAETCGARAAGPVVLALNALSPQTVVRDGDRLKCVVP